MKKTDHSEKRKKIFIALGSFLIGFLSAYGIQGLVLSEEEEKKEPETPSSPIEKEDRSFENNKRDVRRVDNRQDYRSRHNNNYHKNNQIKNH